MGQTRGKAGLQEDVDRAQVQPMQTINQFYVDASFLCGGILC
ncbi:MULTISPECIES: hypothetical protein [Pontibacillus]|uniref:Uncharacterized protein n=1 Tax=Pontibacillus chungwhensis TaxID=265426 RepID=A0ABY8V2F6_9BACI|nr:MULTISPECIES: hypothetical protein [Pontibacillus]WIF99181.1 hypothetical protein QNI29_05855 [Pontibacillus chungwhensis]